MSEEKEQIIMPSVLRRSFLGIGQRYEGKVRDTYFLPDGTLLLVTTDRLSAFDRALAAIPYKGAVLNSVAAWWFQQTRDIVPNHMISVPAPGVMQCRKLKMFPVEFVVRGYITGTTSTSLWTHYKNGARSYCGNDFPEGLKKNDKLTHNVITPTTKDTEHDEPVTPQQVVEMGLMSQAHWDEAARIVLELFEFGQRTAREHGLLLVDTKYELGLDADGKVTLGDEIHTPDSSRYWLADTYEERHAAGQEPMNIDKEFVRLWFRERCDPYKDAVLPQAPDDLVLELSRRYIMLHDKITDTPFTKSHTDEHTLEAALTQAALLPVHRRCVVIWSHGESEAASLLAAQLNSEDTATDIAVYKEHEFESTMAFYRSARIPIVLVALSNDMHSKLQHNITTTTNNNNNTATSIPLVCVTDASEAAVAAIKAKLV